jgi:ATP-dependent helicase/nuclease subunit A
VRSRLQGAITHLLVDEFQDTDPVQSDILLLLAADDPAENDPDRARVVPGKLFVVGDPKQSIYRFRRADVSLYERIKNRLVAGGARLLHLTTSFRSLPEIQSFVNAAFAPLMTGSPELGQSAYVALSAFRLTRPDQPALVALPAPRPYGRNGKITKKGINESLPDAVAAFLDWLVHHSGYRVLEAGAEVPVSARHVCLLFRRFRAYGEDVTREYVRALEARRIPHVLSGGRSFHSREEVIALRAVLAAIERPDDALAVYATLRGPFVAFHDATLLKVKDELKQLHPLRQLPEQASAEAQEVGGVLALLGQLHRRRNRRPIAETLAAFLSELRAHAGVAIWPTGEQALGNVLRVLDLSRGYERQRGAVSFRGFVDYLDEHAALGETAEAPVIEETSDGVRIMTVHSAKGLEFPIVVLCDPTAPRRNERPSRFIDPARRLWAQALCGAEPVELLEHRELVRDHDEAEEVRLAYVAATRARDMLVVPAVGDGSFEGWVDALGTALHPPREQRQKPLGPGPRCPVFGRDSVVERPLDAASSEADAVVPGEHAPIAGSHRVVWWDPHVLDLARPSAGGLRQAELLRVDEAKEKDDPYIAAQRSFVEERALLIARASAKSLSTVSVTARSLALAEPGDVARPWRPFETLDAVMERAGRPSGTRFGSLVHALLQHSSLVPDRDELALLARSIGRSLGATPAEVERALADVHKALAHPIFARMRAASARGELYRETPIAIREADGTLVDGVVDAAFRDGERLVLIDYKTDMSIADPSKYGHQLTLYAEALEQLFGVPVTAMLLRV